LDFNKWLGLNTAAASEVEKDMIEVDPLIGNLIKTS